MSRVIVLDSHPLSLLTSPRLTPQVLACTQWYQNCLTAGCRFVVPEVIDYELRRELTRSNRTNSLALLDAFNVAEPGRYIPLSTSAMRLAAQLWAQARNTGHTTAPPEALDGDVILAAQALELGLPVTDFLVATSNVRHLLPFVPAQEWQTITP